jgi:hypothetical protein
VPGVIMSKFALVRKDGTMRSQPLFSLFFCVTGLFFLFCGDKGASTNPEIIGPVIASIQPVIEQDYIGH